MECVVNSMPNAPDVGDMSILILDRSVDDMELDEVIRLERYKNELLRQIRFMEDEVTDLKDSVETIDTKLKDINKFVIEALTTKGMTVRVVTGEEQERE